MSTSLGKAGKYYAIFVNYLIEQASWAFTTPLIKDFLGDLYKNRLFLLYITKENALVHNAIAGIATLGHFNVHIIHNPVIGGVNTNPVSPGIDLKPSVGSTLANHEACHIAGRNAQMAAQAQHNVGIILAHACALVQCLLGRGAGVGAFGLINEAMIKLIAHAQGLLHRIPLLLR